VSAAPSVCSSEWISIQKYLRPLNIKNRLGHSSFYRIALFFALINDLWERVGCSSSLLQAAPALGKSALKLDALPRLAR